jgi:hypothetical protein
MPQGEMAFPDLEALFQSRCRNFLIARRTLVTIRIHKSIWVRGMNVTAVAAFCMKQHISFS